MSPLRVIRRGAGYRDDVALRGGTATRSRFEVMVRQPIHGDRDVPVFRVETHRAHMGIVSCGVVVIDL